MYLERYDLDKVTDKIFKQMFALVTADGRNLKVSRKHFFISIESKDYVLRIHTSGSIWTGEMPEDTVEITPHLQAISHMLLESQWHDPKTEPPKVRDAVILKLSNGDIIHAKCIGIRFNKNTVYFEGASRHYDINLVTGWLPAENVIP